MRHAFILTAALLCACAGASPAPSQEREYPERWSDPPIGETVSRTEAEWEELLSGAEFSILRQQGTEFAFSGRWHDEHRDGIFRCAGCGAPLFASGRKFDSGTGWPSFDQPIEPGRVDRTTDRSYGMVRVEVHCARCGGHLGHVFRDGPPQTTGLRYCINSRSLDFERDEAAAE